MQYESHGKFKIWRQGSVVFAKLIGSWNVESALQFEHEFKKIASTMPDRWGHMVYLNDWELCVPEMITIIERLVAWCLDNGLVRAANIYLSSAIKTQILNRMIVTTQDNFQRAVFDNELDAVDWLSDEGFPVVLKQGTIF